MTLKALSNTGKEFNIVKSENTITVKKSDIPKGLEYIEIFDESLFAKAGDEGYFCIADLDGKGSGLCFFNRKSNGKRVFKQNLMPIYGIKKADRCVLVIVEGYKYDFNIVFEVCDGIYRIYPKFDLYGAVPFCDITLRYIELEPDATYSDMAKAYRNYKLSCGQCKPLAERIKNNRSLGYAMQAPEIRIRMGWKPAPAQVLEQTPENEPPMKVACTFSRVRDIIDELKNQGVDKAQICLVGWNVSGHDGRYPQIFPVEPALGGERELKKLISYAKENGYRIVCHTNSTDCYSIAEDFSEDIVVKDRNGDMSFRADVAWSGGRQYHLCPKKAYEFAMRDLPAVRALGFEGLHYIDVLSVVPLRWCYDKKHPVTSADTLEIYEKIMARSAELFGGFASEGCFDFASKYLDYGLYVSWVPEEDAMIDKHIPLWQMVYHGIILYNRTTDTVNYTVKAEKNHLQVIEDGSRPSFYFYSRFLEGSHQDDWLGKEDMVCDTDEQLKYSVSKIKQAYDEYKNTCRLQMQFIESHDEVSGGIFVTKYSDGTTVTVDYNREKYSISK
ncbi:MAG: hypothetical protein IKV97_01385 [Clostridia bacterium]|nr:hypothetical protein [Clostridia bacterium]